MRSGSPYLRIRGTRASWRTPPPGPGRLGDGYVTVGPDGEVVERYRRHGGFVDFYAREILPHFAG